jgi:hypothetical protein
MHDFSEVIRKSGPHSAWCGGKTVDYIRENGYEFEFCFTDGTSARFEIVDDDGKPIRGKLKVKSLGTHIMAKSARITKLVTVR